MCQKQYGALMPDREADQQANELCYLGPVVLIAGKQIGESVEHQQFRCLVVQPLIQFLEQRGRGDNACRPVERCQKRVLSGKASENKAVEV